MERALQRRRIGGCGGAIALAAALAGSGCAADLKRANLRELQMRAAFDLSCPPQSLGLYPFDERSKGVAGCGKRLTYVEICDYGTASCTWMIDGFLPAAVAAEKPQGPGALGPVVLGPPPPPVVIVPPPPVAPPPVAPPPVAPPPVAPPPLKPLDLEDRK